MDNSLDTLSDLFGDFKITDRFVEHRCCLCDEICALTIKTPASAQGSDMICSHCAQLFDYLRGVLGVWPYLNNSQGTEIRSQAKHNETKYENVTSDLFALLDLKHDARIYEETRVKR